MKKIEIIDLHFADQKDAVAAFVIASSEGPILVETGPYATFNQLKKGLEMNGYYIEDVKHVFLTHIHLDHAGAAWALAELGAKIYVHPFGAKNLEDPSRLMESAKRIYQDQMDALWGDMKAIPTSQLCEVDHLSSITIGDLTIKSWHTPGHAKHHIAWQVEDCLFVGDVAGVKIGKGPVQPPCPPPDIDIEVWKQSLQLILNSTASKLYLTHFGIIHDVKPHLDALSLALDDWSLFIKNQWEKGLSNEEIVPLFVDYSQRQLSDAGLSQTEIDRYQVANPSWMSVAGLVRYWSKRA